MKALQVMATYSSQFDIQQGGEHGRTALHLAAMHDHEDCAKILVKFYPYNVGFPQDFFSIYSLFFTCLLSRLPSLERRLAWPVTLVSIYI